MVVTASSPDVDGEVEKKTEVTILTVVLGGGCGGGSMT